MLIVRVSYGYWYTRGSGQVINNGTNINGRCVRSNSFRKLSGRTGEMLIKNFVGAQLPFPFFSLLLPSSFSFYVYFHIFTRPHAKESAGSLKLVSGSGQSPAAKRHLVNFVLKECFW